MTAFAYASSSFDHFPFRYVCVVDFLLAGWRIQVMLDEGSTRIGALILCFVEETSDMHCNADIDANVEEVQDSAVGVGVWLSVPCDDNDVN
jgi:hypothetical protein